MCHSAQAEEVHIPFSKGETICRNLLTRKADKERISDVINPLESHSGWVCLPSCADARQAEGAAYSFRTMALSSQCLSRHGCILRYQVHHIPDALLILGMLVLWSVAQPQIWSRKISRKINQL